MKRWAWACLAASITCSARGLGRAVADVVENRVVEEHRLLGDQPDLAADVAEPHVGQGHAVELDHAGGGIGETRNQVGQRALAAAVGADDGDRLAEGDPQIDLFEHRLARLIGEADVLEHQIAVVAVEGDGLFRIADLRLAIEPREDPVGGGDSRLADG